MDASWGARRFRHESQVSQGPQLAIYVAGRFFRLLSVYATFKYLLSSGGSNATVAVFMFVCTLFSGAVFLVLQRPWHGRPVSRTQLVPTVLNGVVLALSLLFWGRSLVICGPVRTILAEYTGAVLGAASTLALGRGGNKLRKFCGLVAMLLAFFILSKGWAMSSFSPFNFLANSGVHKEEDATSNEERGLVGLGSMSMSIIAGTLLALRRVIARRVSLKTQSKKRFHSITVASAACFLFPVAMFFLASGGNVDQQQQPQSSSPAWAYLSTVTFGMVMAFYVDSYAEERLRIHASSPWHLLITACCLVLLELLHGLDFSLLGFVVCCSVLGVGVFEATTNERLQPAMRLPYGSEEDMTRPQQRQEEMDTFESLVPP